MYLLREVQPLFFKGKKVNLQLNWSYLLFLVKRGITRLSVLSWELKIKL